MWVNAELNCTIIIIIKYPTVPTSPSSALQDKMPPLLRSITPVTALQELWEPYIILWSCTALWCIDDPTSSRGPYNCSSFLDHNSYSPGWSFRVHLVVWRNTYKGAFCVTVRSLNGNILPVTTATIPCLQLSGLQTSPEENILRKQPSVYNYSVMLP